ncbi:MAG TPA: iron-sulfur cluster repair di-iron protein [Chitinophagaceae bacterium]|nr:iron-sulfur cluster repair di-iron protein [Chitinophagaceae bacterium]
MINILDQTLAQIVTSNHQAASVFEKYNLDFCCNGKRSLQKACEEKSLSADQIAAELSQAIVSSSSAQSAVVNYLSLTNLCDYIVDTHHSYVRESTPQIIAYLEKIVFKHGKTFPYIADVLQLMKQLQKELAEHMLKEERILFPRIKQLEKARSQGNDTIPSQEALEMPVSVMEEEHEHAGRLIELIREKTNNYTPPAGACTTHTVTLSALKTFEADLHQHVHLENNILFPKAMAMRLQINEN